MLPMHGIKNTKQCKEIDKSIRSESALADKEVQAEFKSYLDSWYKTLEVYREAAAHFSFQPPSQD